MMTQMINTNQDQEEVLSPDEAAAEIFNGLATNGYSLADKVAVSRSLRRLLRNETEEAQKQLTALLEVL